MRDVGRVLTLHPPPEASGLSLHCHTPRLHTWSIVARKALGALGAAGAPDPATEMRLNTWFAAATFNTAGPTPAVTTAYTRALDLATELDLPEYHLHAL